MNDMEDYEGAVDFEEAGWLDDQEEHDDFEEEYDKIFSDDDEVDRDVDLAYERDPVTGQKAKRPKIAKLNQSNLSQREMDELFLE